MTRNKDLKPGYQNQHDPMRALADRLVKMGSAPDVIYSASAAEKMPMRPFKKGGSVTEQKSSTKRKSCDKAKFAFGGVAKIRHGQSTADGMPKNPRKVSTRKMER